MVPSMLSRTSNILSTIGRQICSIGHWACPLWCRACSLRCQACSLGCQVCSVGWQACSVFAKTEMEVGVGVWINILSSICCLEGDSFPKGKHFSFEPVVLLCVWLLLLLKRWWAIHVVFKVVFTSCTIYSMWCPSLLCSYCSYEAIFAKWPTSQTLLRNFLLDWITCMFQLNHMFRTWARKEWM